MIKSIITLSMVASLALAETYELEPITVESSVDNNSAPAPKEQVSQLDEVEYTVQIQETVPGFKQPIINGLQGDKVLLTVDGIRFTNSLFRDGPNQYYSYIPDEFVIGATLNSDLSAITSNSLGGSVDRTLGIDSTKVGAAYQSNNAGGKGLATYNDKEWSIGAVYKDYGNVRDTNGEVPYSSYNQKGFYAEHKNNEYGTTKILFSRSDDIDRTDKMQQDSYYVYDLQQYILVKHSVKVTDWLEVTPSFQQFREKIDRHSPTSKDIDSTDNIYGLNVSGYYEPKWTEGWFTYGLVENYEDIDYTKGTTDNTYGYNTASLWAKYYDSIGDLDWDIDYKYSRMDVSGDLTKNLDNHSAGINGKYNLAKENYIFASTNLNYKFPTLDNLATAVDGSSTNEPNPDLKQERAITYEVGYFYKGLKLSAFYKDLKDMIIKVDTGRVDTNGDTIYQYQNADNGRIKGIHAEYSRKFKEGILDGYWTYLYAEYLDGKTDYDYISKLTPFHSVAKVGYKPVYVEWLYAPKVPDDEMAEKDQTDYRIADHNYGYNIVNLGYKKVLKKHHQVEAKLLNIFDNRGRVYGSSVDFGERGIYLEYAYIF